MIRLSAMLLGLLLTAQAYAQEPPQAPAKQLTEHVVMALPEGFVQAHMQDTPEQKIMEYIPEGETVEDWSQMVTVQYFPMQTDPEQFYRQLGSMMSGQCGTFRLEEPVSVKSGQYSITRGTTLCGHADYTHLGEITSYSIVNGPQGLHVMQRAARLSAFDATEPGMPLPKDIAKDWVRFFRAAKLCDRISKTCTPI